MHTATDTQPIQDGYMTNSQGHLVPISMIKDIDIARHELVTKIVADARALHDAMAKFKEQTFADILAFVQLSGEQYGVQLGGKKGNVTMLTFDGRFKVVRQFADHIHFDERLQAAKELIDTCIQRWTSDSNDNVKAVVNKAFEVNKEGSVSTGRILGLRSLDIKDPEWLQAMQAIADSITVSGSKAYVRIYERVGDTDQYAAISLDMANI